MTNEEWAKMLKEHLDLLDEKIQAAAHREYFQEDCKCKCECKPHRLTVQELLDVVDLADRVDLAIDGWHLSGTVEALVEALNDETLNATVCSISAGPVGPHLDIIAAREGCKEAENDG